MEYIHIWPELLWWCWVFRSERGARWSELLPAGVQRLFPGLSEHHIWHRICAGALRKVVILVDTGKEIKVFWKWGHFQCKWSAREKFCVCFDFLNCYYFISSSLSEFPFREGKVILWTPWLLSHVIYWFFMLRRNWGLSRPWSHKSFKHAFKCLSAQPRNQNTCFNPANTHLSLQQISWTGK